MTFEEKVAEARKYERALSDWLQRHFGCHILPTYDYSGLGENKAPKLYALKESLVIPDLLVWHKQRTIWMECKWKARADWTRVTQRYETGISRRLFAHYKAVAAITGCPVYIVFIHGKEREIRGEELKALDGKWRPYTGRKMGPHGMLFWDYNNLPLWASLDQLKLENVS